MPVKGVQGEGVETRDKKTKGSAAMKASSRAAPKKMVQAQLPFKRLNPVPKENGTFEEKKIKGTQNLSPDSSSLHALNSSREDLENDDQMDTEELLPLPKAVNGKGPLDHYLKKASKDVCPVIDLTEDSNSGIPDNKLPNGEIQTQLQNGSFSSESGPPSPLPSTDQCNTSMETETQEKEDNCKLKEQNSDYHASRVTCSPKLPVTDMEDNTALKLSPQKDSSAEEESSAPSSTSSPVSAVSSPEAHSGLQEEDCTSPSCLTTPVRKVTVQNSSTEKKNPRSKEHDEKRRKLQAEKQEREKTREEAKVAKERAKEEAKKKRDEEKEMKEKERKEKKEKEDREKAEKLRLKEEKKKEKLEAIE
ncbi:chromatin assembly factor 1 subunit A-B [Bombina bombina]|uniref:chromatin assembly factor 1 subunit A-B n=1 Tax=Bombina bombina TaxID=8345 RepID=UPI00235AE2B7|nr:chromatin assembly factor 1 subunit A-B [Bombina bombina]